MVPERRFSSFFKTDLDQTLRTYAVDTVMVTDIATPICVLTTALDALSHVFSAIIVETVVPRTGRRIMRQSLLPIGRLLCILCCGC